ncbi:hypothetical protein GCM10027614_59630 [Micromonospora vulcania]
MLAQQRQAAILERVRATGGVRVTELATEFGVSDMTIRRDLEALHERGLLAKVHGGATVAGPSSTDEPGFHAKSVRQLSEKAAIADRAAQLVRPGAAVALSAGTTTAELARRLVDVPGLTVVTNSLPVAEILHAGGRPDQTVVLTGGVRTRRTRWSARSRSAPSARCTWICSSSACTASPSGPGSPLRT